jgi:hypothetical protein
MEPITTTVIYFTLTCFTCYIGYNSGVKLYSNHKCEKDINELKKLTSELEFKLDILEKRLMSSTRSTPWSDIMDTTQH